MRKVRLFIAMSLDGYIAKPNDDLSFLSLVDRPDEDYGYTDFVAGIDTIVIGRKTYDYVMKHVSNTHYDNGSRDVYVITHHPLADTKRTKFFKGSPSELIRRLKTQEGKDIYCDGGASVINDLLRNHLIDEMVISVVPILLGSGVRLFEEHRPEQLLELVATKQFASGLAQLHYKRKDK